MGTQNMSYGLIVIYGDECGRRDAAMRGSSRGVSHPVFARAAVMFVCGVAVLKKLGEIAAAPIDEGPSLPSEFPQIMSPICISVRLLKSMAITHNMPDSYG